MSEKTIAEAIQGQFEGAIKRYDEDDALTDAHVKDLARVCSDMFEASVVSRHSKQVVESLRPGGD